MGKAIFAALLLAALLLGAHPPKAVDLSFDAEAGALSVKVRHRVSNPEKHFIVRIEVHSGKELLAERTYERQETAAEQNEVFLFLDEPLAQGSPVTVTAHCSISGKKSADLEW